ncbi:MAG: hypothetical protein JWO58_2873 [Chitinophagaceae bacterium]|nr:hypothetical protein [Chitinophagaceae bacterium]
MQMKQFSHVLHTHAGRPFLIDFTCREDHHKKPVVIFVHGFKGFKDWGPFPLLSEELAIRGWCCIKVNLSHNGTTPDQPLDFADLEAFGRDTLSQHLEDLNTVMNFVTTASAPLPLQEVNTEEIFLIGHSRGGSLVLLQAAEDLRVKKVVTWAAVADLLAGYTPDQLALWKSEGVRYIRNARTQQDMPLYYSYYDDLLKNNARLSVLGAAKKIRQPLLIIHGSADETIAVEDAYAIHLNVPNSELLIIKDAGHTFGGVHPATFETMPSAFQEAVEQSILFFKR